MSYTALALLAVGCAVLLDLLVLRTRVLASRTWWLAYPIVLSFQLLTNGWLTGRGIVRYDPTAILGSARVVAVGNWRVGYAPVEDLGFGFALALVTCAVWVRLRPPDAGPAGTPGVAPRRPRLARRPRRGETVAR